MLFHSTDSWWVGKEFLITGFFFTLKIWVLDFKNITPRKINVHCPTIFTKTALACVAQWIECWPANQRVSSSIPSLGHMPGLQAGSPVWGWGKHTVMFLSFFFLSLFPSLKVNQLIKSFKKF